MAGWRRSPLNTRAVLILNVANRSALPFLDERAVVEVPCVVGARRPGADGGGPGPRRTRARWWRRSRTSSARRSTPRCSGSRELAVKALALHPLVPSVTTARRIFDGYRARLPALQEAFPVTRDRRR